MPHSPIRVANAWSFGLATLTLLGTSCIAPESESEVGMHARMNSAFLGKPPLVGDTLPDAETFCTETGIADPQPP